MVAWISLNSNIGVRSGSLRNLVEELVDRFAEAFQSSGFRYG
jgi:hypothetical protein